MFRTHWMIDENHNFACPAGERIELRHRAVLKKDGSRILVKDREKRTFDIIQSHKEECLIENIIKRALEGDLEVLNQMHGQYIDCTNLPSTLAEAQQKMLDLKQEFSQLPKEIRKEFDYSEEKYIAEWGSESWLKKTGVEKLIEADRKAQEKANAFDQNLEKAMENLAAGGLGKETTENDKEH